MAFSVRGELAIHSHYDCTAHRVEPERRVRGGKPGVGLRICIEEKAHTVLLPRLSDSLANGSPPSLNQLTQMLPR